MFKKNNSKPKVIENFSLFTSKNANVDNNFSRSFDNSLKVDKSFNTNNINNIINTSVNNVSQESSADVLALTIQNNMISLTNVTCPTIRVDGNRQSNLSEAEVKSEIYQTKLNSISSNIMNTVSNKIKSQVPDDTAELVKEMNNAGERFKNDTTLVDRMNEATAKNVANALNGGAFSIGGSISANIKNNIDESIKQALDIDTSTNIETTQNFNNDLRNDIDQISNSRCGTQTIQRNRIQIRGALCNALGGTISVSNNEQSNAAKSYLNCLIDQKSTNQVSQQISSNIDNYFKSYVDQLNEDDPESNEMFKKITDLRKMYYFLIEKATKDDSDDDSKDDETSTKVEKQTIPQTTPDPDIESEANPMFEDPTESKNQKYLMYGVILLMVLFALYMFMK
jgi:hypothetical protein